jgi:hypothetical protein
MRKLLIFIFLLSIFNLNGQSINFEKGKIIDSVKVKNTTETYTLYLPNTFKENQPSAIVFIFDPAARGKIGIQPFIESSEKYNYILVCSNNCKNGPNDENFKFIDNLFKEVLTTFKINQNLIYTAGFSGGSRLASIVAVISKKIQGVIACGAGFSSNLSQKPTFETFSYVGLVGDSDMNYQEMFSVKDWCTRFGIDHEIFTFEGDHRWPPSSEVLKAFDWLQLQAYKKGLKHVNEDIVEETYQKNYVQAKSLENSNQIELSVFEYERILKNYSRYFNLDSISSKVNELKKEKQYRKDVKIREQIISEETKITNIFVQKFNSDIKSEIHKKKNYEWWIRELNKINFKYNKLEDSRFRKMVERIRYSIFALSFETAQEFLRENDIKKAVFCHELNTDIYPSRPYTFLRLSMDYALLNNQESMLFNLKRAMEKGFKNKDYILKQKEFSKYINDAKFKKILDSF